MYKKKREVSKILIFLLIIIAFAVLIFVLKTTKKEDAIDASIKLGGEWFLKNQDENFVVYEYDLNEGRLYTRHVLREMAGLWSVTELRDYTRDPKYEQLEMRGFEYFKKFIIEDLNKNTMVVNITPGDNKIAYSAFMILAISNMNINEKNKYLEMLGNGLLLQQMDDGSLKNYFDSDKNSGIDYYPGESLLALMTLYETTGNAKYLESVKKAFPYYEDYWKKNKNTAFVPWHSRAYYKLYKETKNNEVSDFVFEMNDWMIEYHKPSNNCTEFNFSRGIVTAVYMEGMNKAYELAKEKGDQNRMICYGNFVKAGAEAIIALQVSNTHENRKEAIGGFRGDINSNTLRIDRNQHAVMALMEAKTAGIL